MRRIKKINSNSKLNLKSGMKISIIGAGKSGVYASKLAKTIDAQVLLSDTNKKKNNIKISDITIETGAHSNKILESDLIIKSPGIQNNIDILVSAKKMGISIISEVEFASFFTDSPIIAVTGSNGKSTTVELLHSIF